MKKIVSTLLVVVCLLAAAPMQAQLRWGVKVGTNLNKMSLKSGGKNLKTDNMAGFFVGPMAEFTLPIVGLGVDGSLLYSQKGIKYEDLSGKEKKNRQHMIEIPLNLKYSVGMGDMASVFVAAGPDFAFNLKSDDFFGDVKRKNAEIGINVGLGVKLINHLQIAANYNIPLTKTVDEKILVRTSADDAGGYTEIFSGKNKTWQISLTYMF